MDPRALQDVCSLIGVGMRLPQGKPQMGPRAGHGLCIPLEVDLGLMLNALQQLQGLGGLLGQIWPLLRPLPSAESDQLLHHRLPIQ